MKKYLMTAMAAVAMGVAFTSCSHNTDLYGGEDGSGKINGRTAQEQIELDKAIYKAAFEQAFGKVAPTVDWGFGGYNTRAMTRANAVVSGDPFTFESTSSYYISESSDIPTTAKTYAAAKEAATTHYDWGDQFSENDFQNASEVILQNDTYSIHWWQYNHKLYIIGNVTLNVTGANSINAVKIYLLKNSTLTLNMSNYINDLEIYVASNATLYYNCEKLYKQDGGGKIYSRGTIHFPDNFEANQGSIIYNEGDIYGKDITSKPQQSKPSFFYNFGDLTLTGKMELNSSANFYNGGNVTVSGETNVTQSGIYWINKGHYTTGSMVFSAKNTTFYNFCNLICLGNAHMYDGEFNLMDNSYTEAGSAEMDNFVVNMGSNTGMNIKGDLDLTIGQGDGTYQGFRTSGTNDFLRVAGTVTVAGHMYTLELTGDITYAFNNLVDLGANDSGVQPTYRFNTGTKEAQFDKLTVTPNTNSCGATWNNDGGDPETYRVIAEDYSADDDSDFDFNDVVFDVDPDSDGEGATITILAAGGIWPLTINGEEVHNKLGFGVDTKTVPYTINGQDYLCYPMINTGAPDPKGASTTARPTIHVDGQYHNDTEIRASINAIVVKVFKYDPNMETEGTELPAIIGEASCKILVDQDCLINSEYESLKKKNSKFVEYVGGRFTGKWWKD
jgi:hypothetical protein